MIRYFLIIFLLFGCAAGDLEEYPPKWVIASYSLPRMQGFIHAGFFEMDDTIYSHHCDSNGNMIRMKYDDEGRLWKRIGYDTYGCGEE
tara:strand:+ start:778 stop:1041 length:264 start_codon:yes stop_codon:yes gene_type:complete